MTDQGLSETMSARAWDAQVQYHQERAAQEQSLARASRSETARAAHRMLGEQHRQRAESAQLAAGMSGAELPQSSSLQHTGWLMRNSYEA